MFCDIQCKQTSETFKIFVAVIAAAAVPSAGFALFTNLSEESASFEAVLSLWFLAFIFAFAHAGILGLPVMLFFKNRGWTHWWTSAICGFAIGALPISIFTLPFPEFSLSGIAGLLGASGGLAAWAAWHWQNRGD